jgi:hypothetical protein
MAGVLTKHREQEQAYLNRYGGVSKQIQFSSMESVHLLNGALILFLGCRAALTGF